MRVAATAASLREAKILVRNNEFSDVCVVRLAFSGEDPVPLADRQRTMGAEGDQDGIPAAHAHDTERADVLGTGLRPGRGGAPGSGPRGSYT